MYSLRSLLLFVGLCGILCFLAPYFAYAIEEFHLLITTNSLLYCAIATVFSVVSVLLTCVLGKRLSIKVGLVDARFFLLIIGIFAVVLIAIAWILWVRIHFESTWYSTTPRGWLYADQLLTWYNAWLNARRPAPPGTMKMHGEYDAVRATLDVLILGLISVSGFMLGALNGYKLSNAKRKPVPEENSD